ncbi:6,7-dimethyl-8-ribityllumazine synthase [Enemella evansiae]|uniref:6,7-dimethyl-8-ribityllumazine synthase n=1 Tax=Enemella evansiae TaxID=2016499 RepID=UPI000B9767EB|nr:6,7-dimethyl-8-ribityllumazine synthase [Enemella evansiae]OYN93099.1 6,7-dimethyl-8-ribityllumazine synthase [Enemella evansiae]
MSGHGAPTLELSSVAAGGLRGVIVASSWHEVVMNGLIDGARRGLEQAGLSGEVIRVPGSLELPVACARLAPGHDFLVALGVVIRGGTPHFDHVCQAATMGITRVGVDTGTPIGFGVLTCDTEEQAQARAGLPDSLEDKGFEAAQAAILTAVTLAGAGR